MQTVLINLKAACVIPTALTFTGCVRSRWRKLTCFTLNVTLRGYESVTRHVISDMLLLSWHAC